MNQENAQVSFNNSFEVKSTIFGALKITRFWCLLKLSCLWTFLLFTTSYRLTKEQQTAFMINARTAKKREARKRKTMGCGASSSPNANLAGAAGAAAVPLEVHPAAPDTEFTAKPKADASMPAVTINVPTTIHSDDHKKCIPLQLPAAMQKKHVKEEPDFSTSVPYAHPQNHVYKSLCDWDSAKIESTLQTSPVVNLGESANKKPVNLSVHKIKEVPSSVLQNALQCHFKTTWDRKESSSNNYHEYHDIPCAPPAGVNFVFGEILPSGIRNIFAEPFMTVGDKKKPVHLLDWGCGHGRLIMQLFLEHPNMSVTGVELHPGRFWNAYHAVYRLWLHNKHLYDIVHFDNTENRVIIVKSRLFHNTITVYEGNFFEDRFLQLAKTADHLFVEVAFAHCRSNDPSTCNCEGNISRKLLAHRVLCLKPGATCLFYEPTAQIFNGLEPKGVEPKPCGPKINTTNMFMVKPERIVVKPAEIQENVKEEERTLFTSATKTMFDTRKVQTTWGEHQFEQWVRTRVDAKPFIKPFIDKFLLVK